MAAGDQRERAEIRAAPRPLSTARSAPPRSTWDVALAAAREPGRTARRESVAAAPRAPATPQTAPPAANHRKGPEHAQEGRCLLVLAREQKNSFSSFGILLRIPGLD